MTYKRLNREASKRLAAPILRDRVMASQLVESEVLRNNFSCIHEAIAHPLDMVLLLYQEGVVSKEAVGEVAVSTRPLLEKNAAIMRAVEAAVGAEPKKLWVLISVLERFSESAPVADRMRKELASKGLEGT